MVRKLRSKKGQVPSALTWIVAFLIIFFIMFLFVSASLIIIGKRKIPIVEGGKSKIGIEKARRNLIESEILFALLETKIYGIKLRERILEWNKIQPISSEERENTRKKIENEVSDILFLYENCKYIFDVDAVPENLRNMPVDPRGAGPYYRAISYYKLRKTNIQPVTSDPRGMQYFTSYFNALLNQASKINIGKENPIWVRFYLEC